MKILNTIGAVLALSVCVLFVLIGARVLHDYSLAVGYILTGLLIGQPFLLFLFVELIYFIKAVRNEYIRSYTAKTAKIFKNRQSAIRSDER